MLADASVFLSRLARSTGAGRHSSPLAALCIVLSGIAAAHDAAAQEIGCAGAREPLRLTQAPHGAAREGKTLRVRWRNGTQIFRNTGSSDYLQGLHWQYCGFDAATGLHLIQKAEDGYFSGVLLRDSTGQILPGGFHVVVAPDRVHYLARSQGDGMDGEQWELRVFKTGQLLRHDVSPEGDIDAVWWVSPTELRVRLQCPMLAAAPTNLGHVRVLKLTAAGWTWQPSFTCD